MSNLTLVPSPSRGVAPVQKRKFGQDQSDSDYAPSEAGEIEMPSPKRQRPHQPEDDVVTGEVQGGQSVDPGSGDADASRDRQAGQRGWNRGITNTLRTTFGSAARSALGKEASAPASSAPAASAPVSAAPAAPAPAAEATSESPRPGEERPRTFSYKGCEWILPPPASPRSGAMAPDTWQDRFCKWCEAFVAANESCASSTVIGKAYTQWLDSLAYLSKKQRQSAKAAANEVRRTKKLSQIVMAGKDGLGDNCSGERTPSAATTESSSRSELPEDGEIAAPLDDAASPERILEAADTGSPSHAGMQRYFPGLADEALFCCACASAGHRQDTCPDMACRFCQADSHPSYRCPSRRRCTKCRQLGHAREQCKEKLALASGEAVECAFCESQNHTETDCVAFTRSFRPDDDRLRKVKSLPVYCYCCGAQGHYGTECGLSTATSRPASLEIWSKENCRRYTDPESTEVAIIWDQSSGPVPNGPAADERPNFGGKSIVPRTHIIFQDDEEEEDEGFIRPPVQKPPPPVKIRFQAKASGGGPPGKLDKPPLPPGPPPPPTGLANLPRRPPPPASRRGKRQRGTGGARQVWQDQAPSRRNERPQRGNGSRRGKAKA